MSNNGQFPAHHKHKVENEKDPEQITDHVNDAIRKQFAQRFNITCSSRNEPADGFLSKN
jgi:hypothetical protein